MIVKDSDLIPVSKQPAVGSVINVDKTGHESYFNNKLSLKASLLSGYSLLAQTENRNFMSQQNPRVMMRQCQSREQCVWFATYDDDMRQDVFAGKIAHCAEQELPSEFCSWQLGQYEPFLLNSNAVAIRKCESLQKLFETKGTTLVRLYLVKMT